MTRRIAATFRPQPSTTATQPAKVFVPASARTMGTGIIAERGTGKTTLLGDLGCQNLQKKIPQVLFDPQGTLTPAFLYRMESFLQGMPPGLHRRFWKRLRVVDVGNPDDVTPFPIYYRTGSETLREVAERFIDTLRLAHPNLVKQASVTFPNLRRVGINTGMVLAALGFQLTEAEDLLFNTFEWEKVGRFAEAIRRNPEAAPAVAYFREQYLPLSRSQKTSLTSSFLDHVFQFSHDPKLRLLFGAKTPELKWADVEEQGQTVILDFKNVHDPETKRFALLWIFLTLYEFLKQRGRMHVPFGITIDEFAALTQQVSDEANPLAVRLDEFLNQYMRNNRIWFTCAFQSITQLDEQLRHTILSLGNLLVGRATMPDARVLADMLWKKNPYMAKEYREDWRDEERHTWVRFGNGYHRETRTQSVLVAREVISYLTLEEQRELFAQKIEALPAFSFFLRPALREGTVSQDVIPISIECLVRDSITGEYQFPNDDLMAKYRAGLATRGGIPAETIRAEQEKRLTVPLPQQPPQERPSTPQAQPAAKPAPTSAEEVREHQTFRLPDVTPVSVPPQTNPRSTKKTQSLPTLDEKEHAFLTFITEHPDTPVTVVYKELGIGVSTGTKIRESLKQQGFLVELELRTGSTTAGRPMKCPIPTVAALEFLEKDPPPSRGGMIHRTVQRMVQEGAVAKGYTARLEQALRTGSIVDVHLEKAGETIAVEIAVVSTPEREISHIKNCLQCGYNQVFGIFADETLLGRTATALTQTFSSDEQGKVRLIPLSKLAHFGEG